MAANDIADRQNPDSQNEWEMLSVDESRQVDERYSEYVPGQNSYTLTGDHQFYL